jgi:hypothetical protein
MFCPTKDVIFGIEDLGDKPSGTCLRRVVGNGDVQVAMRVSGGELRGPRMGEGKHNPGNK